MSLPSDDVPYRSTAHILSRPVEQRLAEEKESTQVTAALPALQGVVDRLNERIAYYGDVDSNKSDVETQPEVHQRITLLNKGMKAELIMERNNIQELIDTYSK